jgi:hypothetical protein
MKFFYTIMVLVLLGLMVWNVLNFEKIDVRFILDILLKMWCGNQLYYKFGVIVLGVCELGLVV